MLGKLHILCLFPNLFNQFNKTRALISTHVRSSVFSLLTMKTVQGQRIECVTENCSMADAFFFDLC